MGRFQSLLGLGYLSDRDFTGRRSSGAAWVPRFSDETILTYGIPILKALSVSPDEKERIYQIIDQMEIPMDNCLAVVEALSDMDYLIILEKDLKGNHLLFLTEKGRKMLG